MSGMSAAAVMRCCPPLLLLLLTSLCLSKLSMPGSRFERNDSFDRSFQSKSQTRLVPIIWEGERGRERERKGLGVCGVESGGANALWKLFASLPTALLLFTWQSSPSLRS